MSQPSKDEPIVQSEKDVSATAETGPNQTKPVEQNQNSEGVTLVRTPSMLSEFRCPENTFPPITPKGVEMNDEQLKFAKAAAKAARIKLSTDRGQS